MNFLIKWSCLMSAVLFPAKDVISTLASQPVQGPYDFEALPPFPAALNPLAQSLLELAKEHKQHPGQKIPVVGIGGCPGVGKTVVTNMTLKELKSRGVNCVVVRFDDWENLPEDKPLGINLPPKDYFNLQGIHDFFKRLNEGFLLIEKPVVNEFTDEHSKEILDLNDVDLILFEGLLALSAPEKEPLMCYSQYCDQGVFVEANEADIGRWKKARPTANPRTDQQFAVHMEAILKNYHENIKPFKDKATWVISKGSDHEYSLLAR